jgi:3-phenylpropionate/cinnamic acid dioxygenase small subunit
MTADAAIHQTLYRYAWGIDTGDADLVAGCYTEDAELTAASGSTHGREAIRADVEAKREERAARGIVRHFNTNVLVTPEGDGRASVQSLFAATVVRDGAASLFATGWYEDTFVEEQGTWRIARRVIHMDRN